MPVLPLVVAIACGVLIGIERGWRQRSVPDGGRVAGVRTFTLLGLLGGLCGVLAEGLHWAIAALMLGAVLAMLGRLTLRELARDGSTSVTNFVAMTLAMGLGVAATSGMPRLAIALAAFATLILSMRDELHGLMSRLEETDLRAFAQYAIIALVVLPFLPDQDFGPFNALNPQHLWMVVVVVTGLSFLGYVANRVVGTKHGTLATAIIGGLYSSTAVTLTLARRLKAEQGNQRLISSGIAIASGLMLVRTVILTAIVARYALGPVGTTLVPAILAAALLGVILMLGASAAENAMPVSTGNPIELLPAFGFLCLVAAASVGAHWAQGQFGESGIAGLLIATGMLDVDAATVTLGTLGPTIIGPGFAGPALAAPLLANTLVKASIVFLSAGWSRGWMAISCLLATAGVLAISIIVSIQPFA